MLSHPFFGLQGDELFSGQALDLQRLLWTLNPPLQRKGRQLEHVE